MSTKGKFKNEARDAAIYLFGRHSGLSLMEIDEAFGAVRLFAASLANRVIEEDREVETISEQDQPVGRVVAHKGEKDQI